MIAPPLILASTSLRRRAMLAGAGVDARPEAPPVDDGRLVPGAVAPAYWVTALAYLKARSVADALRRAGVAAGTVLGADTVCVLDGRILGQPSDADAARAMLRALRGRGHDVLTGVALVDLATGARTLLVDRAIVTVGDLDDATIDAYVESGGWRGKAGAYNLGDRLDAGWPLTFDGDPATVMGLPLRRLQRWLDGLPPEPAP